jgi:hypothetical protein
MVWGYPPDPSTRKNRGLVCYYCLRVFGARFKAKYRSVEALKSVFGTQMQVMQMFMHWRGIGSRNVPEGREQRGYRALGGRGHHEAPDLQAGDGNSLGGFTLGVVGGYGMTSAAGSEPFVRCCLPPPFTVHPAQLIYRAN